MARAWHLACIYKIHGASGCSPKAVEVPLDAELLRHAGAQRRENSYPRGALFCHPEARRAAAALRLSPGARGGDVVVVGAEGPELVAEGAPARGAHRGSSARLQRL